MSQCIQFRFYILETNQLINLTMYIVTLYGHLSICILTLYSYMSQKVPFRIFRKGWVIFSKLLLNYKPQPISTSIQKGIRIQNYKKNILLDLFFLNFWKTACPKKQLALKSFSLKFFFVLIFLVIAFFACNRLKSCIF